MTTMERGVAHFRFNGEALTRIARDLVVEGRWQMAAAMLREGLEGMTYDLAYKILAGNLTLVGDEHEMTLQTDDATEHKSRIAYRYAGLLRGKDRRLYKPYACVVSWGPEDAAYAKRLHYENQGRVLANFEPTSKWMDARSHYYMDAPTDCVIHVIHPSRDYRVHTLWALWDNQEIPPWLPEPTSDPYVAWLASVRKSPLDIRGAHEERREVPLRFGDDGFPRDVPPSQRVPKIETTRRITVPAAASATSNSPVLDRRALDRRYIIQSLARHYRHGVTLAMGLRPRVLREVERSGTEWIRIPLGKRGAGLRVAKAPFVLWACRSETFDPNPADVRDYRIQAHSGMRWGNAVDSAAHSDWMISGGFTWFALYQVTKDDAAHRMARRFRSAVFRATLREVKDPGANVVLNAGPVGVITGTVVHPGIDEEVPAGSIIAVPNASPDYAIPAMSAGAGGAVLTLDGGVLAHLTVVGMEMGFRVVRVHALPVAGTRVSVYPSGEVITVGVAE